MNPLFGKILFLVGMVASIAIRVPHDKISKETKNIYSGKGVLEKNHRINSLKHKSRSRGCGS